ncbi:hypothetical protein Tco_0522997 [Tanacetum coccineum]
MSSLTVTYTSVYTNFEPWRLHCVSDDELEAPQSPGQAPPSPDYVPGPEHPPSPDYVSSLEEPEQAPLSLDYVPDPEYPEYLVTYDIKAPIEDQPLPDDASHAALSPGYVADFDPDEDPKEEPKEDPANYPADGGDDADDESSDDDDDDDDEEEEQEAFEDDEEEEDEHPALADSLVVPVDDPVPSTKDTEAFETDESAPLPILSPRRRRARISIRPQTPMSAATEALIAAIPSPPLPLPSPPTHTSPTYVESPLGYRAAEIRLRAASPSTHHLSEIPSPLLFLPYTTHRDDILEANMPLRKRAYFSTPASKFEVGESSSVVAARSQAMEAQIRALKRNVDVLQRQRIRDNDKLTTNIQHEHDRFKNAAKEKNHNKNRPEPMTDAAIKALIAQGVADALAKIKANKTSRNGDESHNSRTGSRKTERAARKCTYSDFLKCQPLNFKGTEGVIKFATWTLLGSALTWWNSHVKTVGHDAAYGMLWKTLKNIMTAKYCPRGEIKKLEIKL